VIQINLLEGRKDFARILAEVSGGDQLSKQYRTALVADDHFHPPFAANL
jgi:hypothetical protein